MYPFRAKFDKRKCFWVSDIHAQHKNICKGVSSWESGYRDFKHLDEMHETIFANINRVVPEDGFLFDIGDGLFGDKKNCREYRHRIKCKNIFRLFGNHCLWLREDESLQKELYSWCGDYLEIFIEKQLIIMHHYAPAVWNESHRGSWYLYGHSHASFPDRINSKSIDVGVDCEYGTKNGRLVMNGCFDRCATDKGYETIKLDDVIHKRFHPFTFDELEEIMSYKNQEHVDHHNKKEMQ